jgi:soluble lytic murein transglycosylase-like protein
MPAARRTEPLARPLRDARFALATHALALAIGIGAAPGASASAPDGPGRDRAGAAQPPSQRALHLTQLGVRYEHAEGESRDYARAHALYCEAARDDHADALLRLGWMYANGRGVPRDDSVAHTMFARAASLGNDLGARLAAAIRGDGEREPDCLRPAPVAAAPATDSAAAGVAAESEPTPQVEAPATFRPAPSSAEHRRLVQTVVQMAREFRLDPRLVFALIRVESNFDPLARSPKNAQGLMQLIPETAERFAVTDVWNPIENLRGGMSYLRWLLSYYRGDVVLTLAAYNAGEGAVDRHRGVPPFGETLAYVQRIRTFYPFDRHAFDPKVAASFGVSPAARAAAAGPRRDG